MSRVQTYFRTMCGSPLMVLLASASAGCGLVKLNVNGQPMGGSQSSGNAANPAAVAAAAGQADQSKLALPKTVGAKVGPASLKPRLTTEVIKVAVEQNAGDLGFRCGTAWAQGYSTAAPAYSFHVTEAFDLSVRLADSWDGVSGIMMFPDGSTVCSDNGQFPAAGWPKGDYHLFLLTSSSTAAGRLEFSSASVARGAAPVLTVAKATSQPMHVDTGEVTYVGGYNRVFNDSNYQLECTSSEVSDQPSAIVDLAAPTPSTRISVWGENLNGFVYRAGGKTIIQCGSIALAPQGGWPAGKVEVFPMGRLNEKGNTFTVVVDDPQTLAVDEKVQAIAIDGKLAKPKFVTLALRDGRWRMPETLSGSSCGNAAFAGIADMVFTLARPVPGFTVRPLATESGVKTLLRYERQSYCQGRGNNQRNGKPDDAIGAFDAPSWEADGTVTLDDNADGRYELHVGAPASASGNVTFMIYDDSTEFTPLERAALDPAAVGNREIARAFPQLSLKRVTARNRVGLEMAAQLFATAPRDFFVYPKIALDKDLAKPSFGGPLGPDGPLAGDENVPALNEPLLVLDADAGDVLTADGLVFRVAPKYLVAKPSGEPVLPAAPRPIFAKRAVGYLATLLPTTSTSFAAFRKLEEGFQRCKERAWEPYGRQLPSIRRPGGVDVVVVVNSAYRNIEDAGNRAVIAKCGSDEAFNAKAEKLRVKMLAEFEASRPALLAKARAGFTSN